MKADKHILPAFGDMPVSTLTADSIYDFIAEGRLFTPIYRRYCNSDEDDLQIRCKNLPNFNPLDGIVLPKRKSPEIQLLDEAEQKTLQQYIGSHQNRSTMGTALSITTGLRIGELCPLQWRDIDLEKRILTVSKTMQRIQCPTASSKTKLIITDPKSESSRRQIPIPECMVSFLLKFKGKPNEYILTGTEKPIEPRAMQYRFQTILKTAKLPSVHFHALRHIFASNCIKLGFDVKALGA